MKTLLQTLFFFLLVTQICFAQIYLQTGGKNYNKKKGIIETQDNHLPMNSTNIHSGKNHTFSLPNFKDNLQTKIDPFDVNNTPYPFKNERLIPHSLQKNSPPIHGMLFRQSQIYVIDSAIIRATWGTTRMVFSFNAYGNWTLGLTQDSIGDLWENVALQTTTYDTNNNVLTDASEFWSDGQWVKNLRWSYTYDAIGNNVSSLIEWGYLNEWMITQRETYTYDENRNRLTELSELYQDRQWVNFFRLTYTYDIEGKRISELREDYSGNLWINHWRTTHTFDGNSNIDTVLTEKWADSTWVNYWRDTYTYDVNENELSEVNQHWSNGVWMNDARYACSYDVDGHKLIELREWWADSIWVNWFYDTFEYDELGNPAAVWSYRWVSGSWAPNDVTSKGHVVHITDGAGNDFRSYGYNTTFSCKQIVTGVLSESGSVPPSYSLSQNYPNPFNPTTKISWQLPVGIQATLKVYDILGREVAALVNEYKPAGKYESEFNAEALPSGVYFYQLTTGEYTSVKKMLLLK